MVTMRMKKKKSLKAMRGRDDWRRARQTVPSSCQRKSRSQKRNSRAAQSKWKVEKKEEVEEEEVKKERTQEEARKEEKGVAKQKRRY